MKQLPSISLSLIYLVIGLVKADTHPNIIIILVDDMGYSDMGCYGGEINTPNVDKLAKNGLRFTQCYNSARCCPSRASLLTGLYSHQAGIANFTNPDRSKTLGPAYRGSLNEKCVTLAEVLKPQGYNTYCVGKWHVSRSGTPIDRGFDQFYGYSKGHSASQWDATKYNRLPTTSKPEIDFSQQEKSFFATDAFTDYALEFIQQGQESEKPFFLYLAHSSPHFPLHARPSMRDKYVERYRKGWDRLRQERFERQIEIGLATDTWKLTPLSEVPLEQNPAISNHFGGKPNPNWDSLVPARKEDLAYRMATFAAMLEHVDEGVGKIIQQLEKGGDLANTLILFTSDNGACYEWGPFGFDTKSRRGITKLHQGEELKQIGTKESYHSVGSGWTNLSNTPFRMYKHFNHEGGNCSPLIAHWPKGIAKADRWIRSPIHLMDFMPTICEATGATYPKIHKGKTIHPLEGQSFGSYFKGDHSIQSRTLWFDHFTSSALRKGPWKLVRGNTRYNNRSWELYNIAEDRCETINLIEVEAEKAKNMIQEWQKVANRVGCKEIDFR